MDKCNCSDDKINLIVNKDKFLKTIPNDIFRQKLFYLINLLLKKTKNENNKYISSINKKL